jgi:hypothetical protein
MKHLDFRSFLGSQNHYFTRINVRSFSYMRIYAKLNQLWQLFTRALTYSSEPTAVWESDRPGNRYLKVYDPSSQKTYYFDSEEAALIWFDTRYHSEDGINNDNLAEYNRHSPRCY